MKMYVAVVVLVWFVFTIFWFKMKVDAGGFLEGIFAYIGISTAILMGGAVIGALVMTSPGLMLMYGKEANNRKQDIDRQHHTIPNQRS